MNKETDEKLFMHILHKNRNVKHMTEYLMGNGFIEEYMGIEKKHLALAQMIENSVREKFPLESDVEIEMPVGSFLNYEKEPDSSREEWKRLNEENVFELSTEFLLESKEAEKELEFLKRRFVSEEDIRKNGLGSSRFIKDKKDKEVLGMTVHPALRRVMDQEEVNGVLIPFHFNGEVVGSSVRSVPVIDMKYATSHPDLLIGGWDNVRKSDSDEIIVVEGVFDKMALERVGFEGVCFIHTASPTVPQMAGIVTEAKRKGKKIVLAMDVDKVGSYGMYVWSFIADYAGVEVEFMILGEGKDPAEAVFKYGWGIGNFNTHRTKDREVLKDIFKERNEKKKVDYEGYVKERKKVSVDFKGSR